MRFVPLALLLSLSPSPLLAHDGHGAAALGVTVEELVNASQQWDGQPLPAYPRGQPQLKVLRIGIPAGVVLPWHTHPVINAAVILRGTLALNLKDGTTRVFQPGEAIVEVIDTVQYRPGHRRRGCGRGGVLCGCGRHAHHRAPKACG